MFAVTLPLSYCSTFFKRPKVSEVKICVSLLQLSPGSYSFRGNLQTAVLKANSSHRHLLAVQPLKVLFCMEMCDA